MKSCLWCITKCAVLAAISVLYGYSMLPSVPKHLHNDDERSRMTSIQLVCGDISELKLMSALLNAHTYTHTHTQ